MVKITALSAVLLYGITSFSNAAALPTEHCVEEVIPGPGMPTLAELGLTSANMTENIPLGVSCHFIIVDSNLED